MFSRTFSLYFYCITANVVAFLLNLIIKGCLQDKVFFPSWTLRKVIEFGSLNVLNQFSSWQCMQLWGRRGKGKQKKHADSESGSKKQDPPLLFTWHSHFTDAGQYRFRSCSALWSLCKPCSEEKTLHKVGISHWGCSFTTALGSHYRAVKNMVLPFCLCLPLHYC